MGLADVQGAQPARVRDELLDQRVDGEHGPVSHLDVRGYGLREPLSARQPDLVPHYRRVGGLVQGNITVTPPGYFLVARLFQAAVCSSLAVERRELVVQQLQVDAESLEPLRAGGIFLLSPDMPEHLERIGMAVDLDLPDVAVGAAAEPLFKLNSAMLSILELPQLRSLWYKSQNYFYKIIVTF